MDFRAPKQPETNLKAASWAGVLAHCSETTLFNVSLVRHEEFREDGFSFLIEMSF